MCLSQNKLLAVERDRSEKELELLKNENVSVKAKNSELETENEQLERALGDLREQCMLLLLISDSHTFSYQIQI